VLLEASSMGIPIVTTNDPGCREIVNNGVNGYLIEPNQNDQLENAIIKLIKNPKLRRKIGLKSREIALNNFDLNIIANEYK